MKPRSTSNKLIAQAGAKQIAQAEVLPRNKRIAKENDAARKQEERGDQQAAERDQIIQALEASHNGELNAEYRAVIRAASESDSSFAQIVGAWATSANDLGCEKLFAVMYFYFLLLGCFHHHSQSAE